MTQGIVKQKRFVAMLDTSMCQKPAARMNFRGIRSSKFRHVYGQPAKKVRVWFQHQSCKKWKSCFFHAILANMFWVAFLHTCYFCNSEPGGWRIDFDWLDCAGEMLRGSENQSKCSRFKFLLGQPKVSRCCCRGNDLLWWLMIDWLIEDSARSTQSCWSLSLRCWLIICCVMWAADWFYMLCISCIAYIIYMILTVS